MRVGAPQVFVVGRQVANFAARKVRAAEELVVEDQAGADAGAQRNTDQVALPLPCPAPALPKDEQVGLVLHQDGQAQHGFQVLLQREAAPSQSRRPHHHALRLGDDRWRTHRRAQHLPFQAAGRAAQVVDDLHNPLHAARARHGVRDTTVQDLTAQIGQRTDHRLGDVDADNHAGAAIQFEQGGAAAAAMDAGLAFAHQAPVDQLGDDTGDRGQAQAEAAGQPRPA